MNPATSSRRRIGILRKMGAVSCALVCVVVVTAIHRGVSDGPQSYGQTPKVIAKEPGGTRKAVEEIQTLIGELEAQADAGARSASERRS